MNKLLKLKRWITVPDAAKYLSNIFEETVSVADIYYFVLEGKLKLSVDFVNGATAMRGKVISLEETDCSISYRHAKTLNQLHSGPYSVFYEKYSKVKKLYADIPDVEKDNYEIIIYSMMLNENEFIEFQNVESISGIFDLSMLGAERLDIENEYQNLIGGPEITGVYLDGVFLQDGEGDFYQLQANFKEEYWDKAESRRKEIVMAATISREACENVQKRHKNEREEYEKSYYPAGSLDNFEYIYVVRTKALQDFINMINEEEITKVKSIDPRERNTLLTIIAALCKHCNIDPAGSATATDISSMTQVMGSLVDRDTIRRHFDKIPDVLQRRKN